MVEDGNRQEISRKISTGYDPEKVILFGSYAAGNASEDSDIDLFMIKDTDEPRPQRFVAARKLLYGAKAPVDLTVYTPREIKKSRFKRGSFVN